MPRASRLMIDIFQAIHACSDLIDYWDVGHRADGVVVHLRSRTRYSSDHAAAEVSETIAERIRSHGHRVREVSAVSRLDGGAGRAWHVVVELVIG